MLCKDNLLNNVNSNNKLLLFISGAASSLAFAPIFFFPAFIISISILLIYIKKAKNFKEALFIGWLFGFAHFLIGMYWIAIGITVYIEQFWWAIPFALFGIPLILAIFISVTTWLTMPFKNKNNLYFIIIFSIVWVFMEWVRAWIFTGLPWNLVGYIFCFSEVLLQLSALAGIYGLSFLGIFLSGNLFLLLIGSKDEWYIHSFVSIILILISFFFGYYRLTANPTIFTDIKVRLVQPSIPQILNWDRNILNENIKQHIDLSRPESNLKAPDIVVWSESAVIIPLDRLKVREMIANAVNGDTILITGGVSEYFPENTIKKSFIDEYKLFTTMYGINSKKEIMFNYNKTHLVPFGEYMPYKNILGFKKITAGFIDYSAGETNQISEFQLKNNIIRIRPLICYEAIFPDEVRVSDEKVSLFINITNDSWYGNSSGPYQHFEISRLRAIENGIPLVRVGNNGISGIIDPLGRVIIKTRLNEVIAEEGLVPIKINKTIYSTYGNSGLIALIIFTIFITLCIYSLLYFIKKQKYV